MEYADIAVNFPGSQLPFSYAIPPKFNIKSGQAVWVPFGARIAQGIVTRISGQPSIAVMKEISGIITSAPLLSSVQIKLGQWISNYYIAPIFDSMALMLPPGFSRKLSTYFQTTNEEKGISRLTPEQKHVLLFIKEQGKINSKTVERKIGIQKTKKITSQLLNQGLIIKTQELDKARIKPKALSCIKLTSSSERLDNKIALLTVRRAHSQIAILNFLKTQNQPVAVRQIRKHLNCSYNAINALEEQHLVTREDIIIRRDPLSRIPWATTPPHILTPDQQSAWKSIKEKLVSNQHHVFLLFGVTGSGKTEIYLKALSQVVATGKRGICLIPEISLTRQTVERFASRFPGRVAVLHSGLSPGEQLDEWQWIREGGCDVVIGPRSALFAPQPDLGLIIIDEEHAETYKQEDKSPRYHARDVAIKLSQLSNITTILGSATPDIDSFHKAQSGKYQMVELRERITPHGSSPLPEAEIVNMREELQAGNRGLLSRSLITAIKQALTTNEQIILFLNRRGTSTFIQCPRCGFVFRCPRCSIALTYHTAENKLSCHRCHYSIPVPISCPQCHSQHLKFLGIGTQKVEEELKRLFPNARLLRWDKDTTTRRDAHEKLLVAFRDHRADILIGTQMIAKGLDIPQITLSGIISADTGLNLPDFRAGERTFQLLCQVAGRAGRGLKAGKVIIQTYNPESYIIKAAAKQDYLEFYHQEINYRRQYHYPPFSQFVRLIYTHTNENICRRETERISQLLLREVKGQTASQLKLIGPTPAFALRIRGRYRWQLILQGHNLVQILSRISLPQGWTVDVDPVGTT